MKRAIYTIAALTVLISLTGCLAARHRQDCSNGNCPQASANGSVCENDPSRPCRGGRLGRGDDNFNPGPATGAVAYPYYNTRGPRDFLARNPDSIGP